MSTPIDATYALYRGDELLGIGTAEQLAKERGVSRDTIYWYASPSNLKRVERGVGRTLAVRVDG